MIADLHRNSGSHSSVTPLILMQTRRLVLRAASDEDILVMYERIFSDAEVMRHVFLGGEMTKERAENFMREHFTFGDRRTGIGILTEKPSGNIIGFAGLFPCSALEENDFEIGFVMARSAWGKGYATEIGEEQLAFGFDELDCRRLLGLVDPPNAPSIHTLTKLGMKYLSDVQSPTRPLRSVYAISVEEWRNRMPIGQRV